jgi:hypothetical protein
MKTGDFNWDSEWQSTAAFQLTTKAVSGKSVTCALIGRNLGLSKNTVMQIVQREARA